MIRLEDSYLEAMATMAANPDWVKIAASDIAKPEPVYSTDRLILKKSHRISGGFIADQIHFVSRKSELRHLGLLIAAALIHDTKRDPIINVELTNPVSDMRAIFIDVRYIKSLRTEAFTADVQIEKLNWSFRQPDKHPWNCYPPNDPNDLPYFDLTDRDDGGTFVKYFEARNYLIIGGGFEGLGRLISLLFNISDDRNTIDEFVLEGENGFRGVAPGSAEVAFGVEGSIYWQCFGRDLPE